MGMADAQAVDLGSDVTSRSQRNRLCASAFRVGAAVPALDIRKTLFLGVLGVLGVLGG
jgi:hypothetical protein